MLGLEGLPSRSGASQYKSSTNLVSTETLRLNAGAILYREPPAHYLKASVRPAHRSLLGQPEALLVK